MERSKMKNKNKKKNHITHKFVDFVVDYICYKFKMEI